MAPLIGNASLGSTAPPAPASQFATPILEFTAVQTAEKSSFPASLVENTAPRPTAPSVPASQQSAPTLAPAPPVLAPLVGNVYPRLTVAPLAAHSHLNAIIYPYLNLLRLLWHQIMHISLRSHLRAHNASGTCVSTSNANCGTRPDTSR